MPASILFVHQGYELYGSDRTLIQSVQAAASRWPDARITVLLPCEGALREVLCSVVGDVRVADLAILRKSNLKKMKLRSLGGFLRRIFAARRMMRGYDLTYINTVTVMDYILASGISRGPRIVHIHEIPTGAAVYFFSVLVIMSRAFLVFNSNATRRSFHLPVWQRCEVVWNGAPAVAEAPIVLPHAKLNLLLIGRYNSWKGQAVLLQAITKLAPGAREQVNVRLVGSVFGDQDRFANQLVRMIAEERLADSVEMLPFTSEPGVHYSWADVVVVPSIKPEPFGLVAIEAMAAGRSVIAANHGGLAEIVVDGVTGTLVVPGSVESLSAAIESYIEHPARIAAEGNAGRQRFAAQFEESEYKLKITNVIAGLCEARRA